MFHIFPYFFFALVVMMTIHVSVLAAHQKVFFWFQKFDYGCN